VDQKVCGIQAIFSNNLACLVDFGAEIVVLNRYLRDECLKFLSDTQFGTAM
jgi:hypothetical protein